jgi:hypothetical protein
LATGLFALHGAALDPFREFLVTKKNLLQKTLYPVINEKPA